MEAAAALSAPPWEREPELVGSKVLRGAGGKGSEKNRLTTLDYWFKYLNMSTAPVLDVENAAQLSRFLVALGDPTRQEILVSLAGERLNVGKLSERFSLSRPAVSHHLKVLSDAGLLKRERQGRERVYRVDAAHCRELVKRLAGFVEGCCSGSACC